MIDPAAALVVTRSTEATRADPLLQGLKAFAWVFALALHAALLWGWVRVSRWVPEGGAAPFEVVFVERSMPLEHEIPAMPVPPARPIRKVASPRPEASSTSRLQAVEVAREAPQPPQAPALRLFGSDGALLLPGPSDAVPVFDDRARIRYDRRVALPGATDAAYAEAVALRLRRARTPEDVVMAVVRFLFAAPQPDDCPKIEARLLASDADLSREIDMDKFHRYCK